jgi:hypothetical protein
MTKKFKNKTRRRDILIKAGSKPSPEAIRETNDAIWLLSKIMDHSPRVTTSDVDGMSFNMRLLRQERANEELLRAARKGDADRVRETWDEATEGFRTKAFVVAAEAGHETLCHSMMDMGCVTAIVRSPASVFRRVLDEKTGVFKVSLEAKRLLMKRVRMMNKQQLRRSEEVFSKLTQRVDLRLFSNIIASAETVVRSTCDPKQRAGLRSELESWIDV